MQNMQTENSSNPAPKPETPAGSPGHSPVKTLVPSNSAIGGILSMFSSKTQNSLPNKVDGDSASASNPPAINAGASQNSAVNGEASQNSAVNADTSQNSAVKDEASQNSAVKTEAPQSAAVNLKDIYKTTEGKFITGMAASKIILTPTLNYASDKLTGKNTDKSFTDYYKGAIQDSISTIGKCALFYTVSAYNPIMANKIVVNKVTTDFIVNVATLELKNIYKMCSIEYAKDVGWFVASSATSLIPAGKFINMKEIVSEYPAYAGAVMGSGAAIIDFVGALGQQTVSLIGSLGHKTHDMICHNHVDHS